MGRIEIEGTSLDLLRGAVWRGGERVGSLTERERAFVRRLVAREGEVVSRDELAEEVLGQAPTIVSRALDTAVARLRAKIEPDPERPRLLQTVRGEGFRWGFATDTVGVEVAEVKATAARRLRLGEASLDLERGLVERGSEVEWLTSAERHVLQRLAAAEGRALPAEDLTTSTRVRRTAEERVARVVHRLRRKLARFGTQDTIRTVRGAGYLLAQACWDGEQRPASARGIRDELAWALVRHAATVLEIADCVIYATEGDSLVQVAAHGPKCDERRIIAPLVLEIGRGIVGSAAATLCTERVADTHLDTRYVPDVGVPGRSELAVPIVAQGTLLGVIDSEDPRPDAYADSHVRAFETLAAIACAAGEP